MQLAAGFATVAALYASVGHGGASGYLALMALAGIAPEYMRSSALVLNLFVASVSFWQFARQGFFRWSLFWPFALTSIPMAFVGASLPIDGWLYRRLLGLALFLATLRLLGLLPASDTRRPLLPAIAALIGGLIGLTSGFLGIGGGVLLGPVLLLAGWANAKETACVSALFILVNSFSGLIGQLYSGAFHLHADLIWWIGAALVGGLLGGWLGAARMNQLALRRMLGTVLGIASIKLLVL